MTYHIKAVVEVNEPLDTAKIMTQLIWGDTKGWIDPAYRKTPSGNNHSSQKVLEEALKRKLNETKS